MTRQTQHLKSLLERREVWGVDDHGTGQSLAEYLAHAEQKYTAESKVADLMTLKQFLLNRIEIESNLVGSEEAAVVATRRHAAMKGTLFEWLRARDELLESIIHHESVVKKIKHAFHQQNSNRPSKDRFTPPSSSEIRQKLREISGARAAVAAGVASVTPANWHVRKVELQELIRKRLRLVNTLEVAQAQLLAMREQQVEYEAVDVVASVLSSEVPPTTLLSPDNFDRSLTPAHLETVHIFLCTRVTLPTSCYSYCADLVSKRLHHDVMPLIEVMRAGFNLVTTAN
jgi:hypothetical protein